MLEREILLSARQLINRERHWTSATVLGISIAGLDDRQNRIALTDLNERTL